MYKTTQEGKLRVGTENIMQVSDVNQTWVILILQQVLCRFVIAF